MQYIRQGLIWPASHHLHLLLWGKCCLIVCLFVQMNKRLIHQAGDLARISLFVSSIFGEGVASLQLEIIL